MSRRFSTQSAQGGVSHQESRACEGRYLSVQWIVLVGTLILAWISVAPVIWIGFLLVNHGDAAEAAALSIIGLAAFGWNVMHVRRLLQELFQEGVRPPAAPARQMRAAALFGMQIVVASVCTHLAGPFNPLGMQQWFWMPIAGFAGLILRRRMHLVLVLLLTLVISTLQEHLTKGLGAATFWAVGQITTSVFIMSCSHAVMQASRQRLRITQLAAELRAANALLELQADHASVLAVAEERNRLAREIHDAVGHALTVTGSQLEVAQALWEKNPAGAREAIQKARRAAREGLTEIRRSITGMRASAPEMRSLAESLTALMTGAERPGMKLSFQQSGISRPLPSLVEISLYRCAQEGITNACRHSEASEISLHLDFTSEGSVSLTVADNGRGFSDTAEIGHGLKGLKERASLLRGSLVSGTGPQGGGMCRMVVPA